MHGTRAVRPLEKGTCWSDQARVLLCVSSLVFRLCGAQVGARGQGPWGPVLARRQPDFVTTTVYTSCLAVVLMPWHDKLAESYLAAQLVTAMIAMSPALQESPPNNRWQRLSCCTTTLPGGTNSCTYS